jgi:hypothetical protein
MRRSIENIDWAYMIIVYPFLDEAEKRYSADPDRGGFIPGKGSPLSPYEFRMSINELKSDAYAHPYEDDERGEHRHRWPVELNNDELSALGKIAKGRGLPFDPKKREYRFSELLSEEVDVRRSTPMERHLQRILKEHSIRRRANDPKK